MIYVLINFQYQLRSIAAVHGRLVKLFKSINIGQLHPLSHNRSPTIRSPTIHVPTIRSPTIRSPTIRSPTMRFPFQPSLRLNEVISIRENHFSYTE